MNPPRSKRSVMLARLSQLLKSLGERLHAELSGARHARRILHKLVGKWRSRRGR